MTQVIFMCGPAGSGKTTASLALEAAAFTRLSIDEEAWRDGHHEHPLPDDVAEQMRARLRGRLVDLVASGTDVVLDFAFWSRAVRDDYRRLLAPYGVAPETYYLATPREVVLARLDARKNAGPNEIVLPRAVAEAYFDGFEVPTPDEGPLRILTGSAT
ncbi:hypothetical protein SAMN05216410_1064 [Sanguibacter gelidistatuariae]|uniref:AAA domain-containing protein n=1 Tax=Sanguibacter gelidistatuariae TaxID=1814289 RepID=A0A1G6HI80_9MICO|nr:ATP-binding protein [Sanguibacter gelidistatuariae]SDB93942.1 hypothetical protein SAMN05216410_1064 [Sanguibacter gelidistatuariae]